MGYVARRIPWTKTIARIQAGAIPTGCASEKSGSQPAAGGLGGGLTLALRSKPREVNPEVEL